MGRPLTVRQVRDNLDVDRTMGCTAFAVVTRLQLHAGRCIVTYDMVTDKEVYRNMTMAESCFVLLYPIVYIEDVRKVNSFGNGYLNC